jgi:hypothetical protein
MTATDYAWARQTIAELLAASVTDVFRYVGPPGWGKTITQGEYDELVAAGIRVWLVFESGTDDSSGGFNAGVANAHTALQYTPAGYRGPIWFACDESLTGSALATALDYIRGACSAMGGAQRTGIYGEGLLVQEVHDAGWADFFWQSDSTSFPGNAATLPITQVQQGLAGPLPGTDVDRIVLPLAGPQAPPAPPVPSEERSMPVSQLVQTHPGQQECLQVKDGTLHHYWRNQPNPAWNTEVVCGPLGGRVGKFGVTFPNQVPMVSVISTQLECMVEDSAGVVWHFAQNPGGPWGVDKLPA